MDHNQAEETISLWENNSRKITLKNLKTGETYSFELKHSFIVGRLKEKCDLQITKEDRYMSGRHLKFIMDQSKVYVEDLHSKNGSWLNGKLISARSRIRRNDVLKMGRSEYRVML